MADAAWRVSGDYMESCNCDYLCPCIYTNPQGPATSDHCIAAMAFRIAEGRHGTTPLDGLGFALVLRSGAVMADGGWVFGGIVDQRADEAQRRALAAIVAGEAGGPLGPVRSHLVSDFRGVLFAPISFTLDGMRRRVEIPGVLAFAIAGVPSRKRAEEPLYLDNTAHPAGSRLALARAEELRLSGFGLGLALSGKGNNGHYAPFSWSA